jgi:wyosine [tRNA(Phe)-imidazoG37] synthetase (radical SAM superfamily)
MMLIGLGEPLLDPKIFDRIEYCELHGISTLLSTNGVLLDELAAAKLLSTPLAHITLSFDGASKESFEMYRKGAKFERVQANYVNFARLKHQRKSPMQIVVQMVRMKWMSSSASGARSPASIRSGLKRMRPTFCNRKPLEPARFPGPAIICGAVPFM